MADDVVTKLIQPRGCGRQRHRDNAPADRRHCCCDSIQTESDHSSIRPTSNRPRETFWHSTVVNYKCLVLCSDRNQRSYREQFIAKCTGIYKPIQRWSPSPQNLQAELRRGIRCWQEESAYTYTYRKSQYLDLRLHTTACFPTIHTCLFPTIHTCFDVSVRIRSRPNKCWMWKDNQRLTFMYVDISARWPMIALPAWQCKADEGRWTSRKWYTWSLRMSFNIPRMLCPESESEIFIRSYSRPRRPLLRP